MFKTRLISGIVLVILMLSCIHAGGAVLLALLFLISVIGIQESLKLVKGQSSPLGILSYVLVFFYYVSLYFTGKDIRNGMVSALFFIILSLLLSFAFFVLKYPKFDVELVIHNIFSFVYVPVMLSFIFFLREGNYGLYTVWLIFFGAWGADTCAYCVGMLFGKHKMSPVLSPKKSVEGAVGGVLGATILGFLYGLILVNKGLVPQNSLYIYPILCFLSSFVSIIGDLSASGLKRHFGLKDFGKIIPGHGGILDRFDSIIFVAPVIGAGVYLMESFIK